MARRIYTNELQMEEKTGSNNLLNFGIWIIEGAIEIENRKKEEALEQRVLQVNLAKRSCAFLKKGKILFEVPFDDIKKVKSILDQPLGLMIQFVKDQRSQ